MSANCAAAQSLELTLESVEETLIAGTKQHQQTRRDLATKVRTSQ